MTPYGTIATSSTPTVANLEYTSGPNERLRVALGTQRPWNEMFDYKCFSIPSNFSDVYSRVVANYRYFRMNYSIIGLLLMFISLLWHPISLIIFIFMSAMWMHLYVYRDGPLVILRQTIAGPAVSFGVALVTVVLLSLNGELGSLSNAVNVWMVVFLFHAVFRKTEDLYLDEEAAGFSNSAAADRVSPPQGSSEFCADTSVV